MDNFDLIDEFANLNMKIDKLYSLIEKMQKERGTDLGDWITETEAKSMLEVGATTIWGLRKRGKFSFSKIGKGVYYYRQSIISYLEKK